MDYVFVLVYYCLKGACFLQMSKNAERECIGFVLIHSVQMHIGAENY